MAELKTKRTRASVSGFLKAIPDAGRRKDAMTVLRLMQTITKERPAMWGTSVVGFGVYHYRYASGQEGDWPLVGFSPRTSNLTVYIMPGFKQYGALMEKLGPHKTGVSCLYVRSLDDIHLPTLRELVRRSVRDMKQLVRERARPDTARRRRPSSRPRAVARSERDR